MDIILVKCVNIIKLVFCVEKQGVEFVQILTIITTVLKDYTKQNSTSCSTWGHVIKTETTIFNFTQYLVMYIIY
jgi:hypothetical protein